MEQIVRELTLHPPSHYWDFQIYQTFFFLNVVIYTLKILERSKIIYCLSLNFRGRGGVMLFNAIFKNISVYWWRKPEKPPTCLKSLTNLSCIEYTSPWVEFELTMLVVIGTDCIGSCKILPPSYHNPLCNMYFREHSYVPLR